MGNTYYRPMGGAININYLAVDKRLQHTLLVPEAKIYYGDYILRECEKKILELRKDKRCRYILCDIIFYRGRLSYVS